MIEERSTRLLTALEGRAEALLEALRDARTQRETLSTRLEATKRYHQALEARNTELQASAGKVEAEHKALMEQVAVMQEQLEEARASCLELLEENRELDEQNRELEAHNRRLREGSANGGAAGIFQRQHRPAQGLSALIGQRPRSATPVESREAATAPAEQRETVAAAVEGEATQAGQAQGDLPSIEEPPSPQALLEQWYQRYPKAFFKGHTRPLKVGIHEDLSAREPWPEKLVRRALACYVNLPRYLKSLRPDAERIGLEGDSAGHVDENAAEHASKKLDRLQAERRRKSSTSQRRKKEQTRKGGSEDSGRQAGAASAAPARPQRETAVAGEEKDDPNRLQRKLDELMARHNAR